MNIDDEILANPILRNVLDKFKNQQVKGLAKYGETVNPDSYDVVGWINHRQQESIDAVVYDEVLIGVISQIVEENKLLHEELAQAKEFADCKLNYSNQLSKELVEANEENKKLREALEFYANEAIYEPHCPKEDDYDSDAIEDSGQIARKALEESK